MTGQQPFLPPQRTLMGPGPSDVSPRVLVAGLEPLGLELAVPEPWRLPQLNAVRVPEGVDEARVRRRLLEEFDLEIGAGLGALAGKVWRTGLMAHSPRRRNVEYCLAALAGCPRAEDYGPAATADPVAAASATYGQDPA